MNKIVKFKPTKVLYECEDCGSRMSKLESVDHVCNGNFGLPHPKVTYGDNYPKEYDWMGTSSRGTRRLEIIK